MVHQKFETVPALVSNWLPIQVIRCTVQTQPSYFELYELVCCQTYAQQCVRSKATPMKETDHSLALQKDAYKVRIFDHRRKTTKG